MKKEFKWTESAWPRDYRSNFKKIIEPLGNTVAVFYPDYDLPWAVRGDAFNIGVGGLLVQERTSPEVVHQKFSGSAKSWEAIKKEAYAMFKTVKESEYYLRGKESSRQITETCGTWSHCRSQLSSDGWHTSKDL